MAFNTDQLTALEAALAKGERRVSFGDKTVEYRSIEELMAVIREVRHDLGRTVLFAEDRQRREDADAQA